MTVPSSATIRLPGTLALVSSIIVATALLTWIIPGGEFDRAESQGRSVVVPGTYHSVESEPQGIAEVFSAPLKGFVEAAEVIAFIFLVGGAFGLVNATGAVNASIRAATGVIETNVFLQRATIPLLIAMFSLGGATFGMSEEVLAFIPVFLVFARALGYDVITGVAIPFIGAGAGFASAFLNPFTVGIAQGIAELPLFSGIEYRLITWAVFTMTAILFVVRYAGRVKENPKISPLFGATGILESFPSTATEWGWTLRHKLVIAVSVAGLVGLGTGAIWFGWYIPEISALFLAVGLCAGILGGLGQQKMSDAFLSGAKGMITPALVVAFSRGILVVATDGKIIDTMLSALSGTLTHAPALVSAYLMLIVQTIINFFVPSGSGQAALTMPIMAPLSDLLGISRQTAVLIFQFGDGFTNLIIPTSGVTMGVLGIARIPWEKWARWILPLELIFFGLALVMVTIPVVVGWGD
ncbi:MAG: TIGR00366 family protein [Ignavibacteria bacterium]|nr:TIGR00366 family protein [Ignavibacteria bacterium]